MVDIANTYQVTGEELIEMLEAVQNGFTLQTVEGDNEILSVVLKNGKEEMCYNFLR